MLLKSPFLQIIKIKLKKNYYFLNLYFNHFIVDINFSTGLNFYFVFTSKAFTKWILFFSLPDLNKQTHFSLFHSTFFKLCNKNKINKTKPKSKSSHKIMPRIIQNYQIQTQQCTNSHGIQFYKAKQIGTNKSFILKRLKTDLSSDMSEGTKIGGSNRSQELFNKLINQTKILKKLDHQRIPKCVRILKTTNSIYLVYEYYPCGSLGQFLSKNSLKFPRKIQISRTIIQIVGYIHQKNIIYKGINIDSITIDKDQTLYFTNFTQSEIIQKSIDDQSGLNVDNKQKRNIQQYYQDIKNAAAVIYQVFQFNNIKGKFNIFTNNLQKRLYETLTQIIQNKFDQTSVDILIAILNKKQSSQQTSCTSSPQSPFSPQAKSDLKFTTQDLKRGLQHIITQTNQASIDRNINSKHNLSKLKRQLSSSKQIQSSQSFNTTSLKVSKDMSKTATESFKISTSAKKSTVSSIKASLKEQNLVSHKQKIKLQHTITSRKLLNFILHCIKFIQNCNNNKLFFMLVLKLQLLIDKISQQIKILSKEKLTIKNKQFIHIIKTQTENFQQILVHIKQQIKQKLFNQQDILYIQEAQNEKNNKLNQLIQEKISNQIYLLLQEFINSLYPSENRDFNVVSSNKQNQVVNSMKNIDSLNQSINSPVLRKKHPTKKKVTQEMQKNEEKSTNYQTVKMCYYLSIKLKYGTFQKFFQKKITANMQKLNILKDQYFQVFQNSSISVQNLIQEITARIQRYAKKSSILTIV